MSRLNDKDPVSRKELVRRWDELRKKVPINREVAELIDAGNALADSIEISLEDDDRTPPSKDDVENFLVNVASSLQW